MIVLRSEGLILRIDEQRGGEVLDLVELYAGRQLLAHSPFSTVRPTASDVSERQWLAAHRGGWQFLTPNAGNPCRVAGIDHGFHGAASRSAWAVLDRTNNAVTLEWRGHGLALRRQLTLHRQCLAIECSWIAINDPAPLIAVEHLAVGPELLDPRVEIQVPGGTAYELSETTGPPEPPEDGVEWPRTRLLNGLEEIADRWSLDTNRSRFMVVANLPVGQAQIRNPETGCGLSLEWDHARLPHMWIWHEVRTSAWPWRNAAQLLMLEPASIPHSLGLEAALAHDQAFWAHPDTRDGYRLTATVIRE